MSWDAAKEHEDQYREDRWKALNNEQKAKWFTTPLGSVSELFADYVSDGWTLAGLYDRQWENSAWREEYDKNREADIKKLQGWRIRLASLCSRTRDLRSQFAAWSDHRVRVPLDWDRFEYGRVGFNKTKLDHLDQIVKDKEGGMEQLS